MIASTRRTTLYPDRSRGEVGTKHLTSSPCLPVFLTYMNYRQIPRIANSDLTEFKNVLLFGIQPGLSESPALTFGTDFHHYLLIDTHKNPDGKGALPMNRMLAVLRSDALFMTTLARSLTEKPLFWTDPLTGLFCKAQFDMIIEADGLIVDAKTTSARSQAEFEGNCLRFGYDRQAAFYLDGCRAAGMSVETFRIVGIQKQKPHTVFKLEFNHQDDFIREGRRKYCRLLKSWLQQPFTPSSWQKLPQQA